MPITLKDIKDHKEQFGIDDLGSVHTSEYRRALDEGAFFWIDHHDFIRSTFSEEIIATNTEQLDALIEYLREFRDRMPEPPEWLSEK